MDDEELMKTIKLVNRFDQRTETEDREKLTMYLEEELLDELALRYREIFRQRLEANEDVPLQHLDFYHAVLRAGLEGTSIEEELVIHDLED